MRSLALTSLAALLSLPLLAACDGPVDVDLYDAEDITNLDLDDVSEEHSDFSVPLFDTDHRLHEVELELVRLYALVNEQADRIGHWTPELVAERAALVGMRKDLIEAGSLGGVKLELEATELENEILALDQRIRVEDAEAQAAR